MVSVVIKIEISGNVLFAKCIINTIYKQYITRNFNLDDYADHFCIFLYNWREDFSKPNKYYIFVLFILIHFWHLIKKVTWNMLHVSRLFLNASSGYDWVQKTPLRISRTPSEHRDFVRLLLHSTLGRLSFWYDPARKYNNFHFQKCFFIIKKIWRIFIFFTSCIIMGCLFSLQVV